MFPKSSVFENPAKSLITKRFNRESSNCGRYEGWAWGVPGLPTLARGAAMAVKSLDDTSNFYVWTFRDPYTPITPL